MLGRLVGTDKMEDRDWPTVALTAFARGRGAAIGRIPDARPYAEATRMTEAILGAPWKPAGRR